MKAENSKKGKVESGCDADSRMITAAVKGIPITGERKATMPVRIKIFVSKLANKTLKTEPMLAPIAIAGATKPPAQPAIKVKIVLLILPKTSAYERKTSTRASASVTVLMPPPIE